MSSRANRFLTRPPALRKMGTFADKKLQKVVEETKLGPKIVDWFVANGIDTINKMAMVGSEEKELPALCIEPMNNADLETCKTLGSQAAVKLFWHGCRELWLNSKETADTSVTVGEALIPEKEGKTMMESWMKKHAFMLPDCQLLIASQQAKLWHDFCMDHRELDHWFANKIRHRGEGNPRNVAHTLSLVPGKPIESMAVVLDVVEDKIELWTRIRALLMTLSYVSIEEPDWFPLQVAVLTAEHILKLITATFNKERPPLLYNCCMKQHGAHLERTHAHDEMQRG